LCNLTPEFSDILGHLTKIYVLKIFLTEIKPEYSDILYNLTHFSGSLVWRIRQVPLYKQTWLKCSFYSPVQILHLTLGKSFEIYAQCQGPYKEGQVRIRTLPLFPFWSYAPFHSGVMPIWTHSSNFFLVCNNKHR
jgi:hypothetical protein